jgi:serine protease inhibitor
LSGIFLLMVIIMMPDNKILAAQPKTPSETDPVVTSSNQFAVDLYAKLAAESDKNLFFSPESISSALSMTYVGARGDTATEMGKVLHLDSAGENIAAAQAALNKQLNDGGKGGDYQLAIANRLWGAEGHHFLEKYLKTLRDDYSADLEQLDFKANAEKARKTINDWVEKATQGKIQDLIPEGMVDATTKLVLTNAVYFKGKWSKPFNADATQKAPFYLPSGEQADVALMHSKQERRVGKFDLAGQGQVQVLELPYEGDQLSMVILLPEAKDGLAALEKQLSMENLKQWMTKIRGGDVNVWLPKFKMSSEFQLRDVLAELGMPEAFSGKADFSGMDGERDLLISAVVHKAYVDVNEEGTEAAAATGVGMRVMARPINPQVVEFRADHPFLFLIRSMKTGCILFMGRVNDPR